MARQLVRKASPGVPLGARTRHARLVSWQAKFASWLAGAHKPSRADQVLAATKLANEGRADGTPEVTVTYAAVKWLKRREDFRELVAAIEQGGIEAARAVLVTDMPLYMELHRWGVERAREKDDVRAVSSFTVPVMDRVLPKRSEIEIPPTHIVIKITPAQAASFEQGPPVIEAEVADVEEDDGWPALPPGE